MSTNVSCANCARLFPTARGLTNHARKCVPTAATIVLDGTPVVTLSSLMTAQPARFPQCKTQRDAAVRVPNAHLRYASFAPTKNVWKRLVANSATAHVLVTQAWADEGIVPPAPAVAVAVVEEAATDSLAAGETKEALEVLLLRAKIERAKNDVACATRVADADVACKHAETDAIVAGTEIKRAIASARVERIEKTGVAYVRHVEEETRRCRIANNQPRLLTPFVACLAPGEMRVWGTPAQPWYRAEDVSQHISQRLQVESAPGFATGLAKVADRLASRQDGVLDAATNETVSGAFIPIASLCSSFHHIGRALDPEALEALEALEDAEDDEDDEEEADEELAGVKLVQTCEQLERARRELERFVADLRSVSEGARRAAADKIGATVDAMMAQLECVKRNAGCYIPAAVRRYADDQAACLEKGAKKALPNRDAFWIKRMGMVDEAPCDTCAKPVKREAYERGHVVSKKHGGSNAEANLVAICGSCNGRMGTMDALLFGAHASS